MIDEKIDLQNVFIKSYNLSCIGNPGPPKLSGTRKVTQLTGDTDRETGHMTSNQTGKNFGIYGTDLGVSFLYDGKLYFLFGDTNTRGPDSGLPQSALPGYPYNENETDYDAIAYTTTEHAYDGINLVFNSKYPLVDGISQLTAEHPIDGFSIGQEMYVFFTTDLKKSGRIQPTRTVLARSIDGGYNFSKPLYTLSKDKFIHVSVEKVDSENIDGIPKTSSKGLLIWGTGEHRKSDVFLAYAPLDEITNRSSIIYFSGMDTDSKMPIWKSDESSAMPLFSSNCMSELSVRWNYYLGKWIMLYNCDLCNTRGVIVRLADSPWGPWSSPKIVFDPSEGYGRFIHQPGMDNLNDRDRDGPSDWGDIYGPYQMAPYATGIKGRYTKIYFTLSTWNPYQTIQMSAILTSNNEEEGNSPQPYASSIDDRNDRKFAYVSVLLAHVAKLKGLDFHNYTQSSTFIADHIEWAQFHSHLELRAELKDKLSKIISSFASDVDKADVFTAFHAALARLGYEYNAFYNIPNSNVYRKWALNVIHTGNSKWLLDELYQMIDNENFLRNNDYLCYAYGPDDSNEFKYSRISILFELALSNSNKTYGNLKQEKEGVRDCNYYSAWARFRSVEEMRQSLLNKFKQIVYESTSEDSIANAYDITTNAIIKLSTTANVIDGPNDEKNPNNYQWALSMLNSNKHESVIDEMSKSINSEYFLTSIPNC